VWNLKVWETPTFDFLESVAMRIETRNGRLEPTILKSIELYKEDQEHVLTTIDNGQHFR
jgi:hypothetical protein